MINAGGFRALFPQFTAELHPDALVDAIIGVATNQINAARFGPSAAEVWAEPYPAATQYDLVICYYVAHWLAMQQKAIDGTLNSGLVSSRQVDGVGVQYYFAATTLRDAGTYNLTPYGILFWQMIRFAGSGGMQIGVPSANGLYYGSAVWLGPPAAIIPLPY